MREIAANIFSPVGLLHIKRLVALTYDNNMDAGAEGPVPGFEF